MGKKGRKTREAEEAPVVDEALPETQELPHDRFPPLWRNVYWGQVLFGAVATWLGLRIADRARDGSLLATLQGFGLLVGALFAVGVFLVYLQNLYKHGIVPDYSLKCRHCEGPVNRYSEFCEHCGADLIAEEKLLSCPKCGVEVYEGTKHCPECGAKVGKGGKKKTPPPGEPEGAASGWDRPLSVDDRMPWER